MKNYILLFFLYLFFGCHNPNIKKDLVLVKKVDVKIVKKDSVKEINEIVLRESFVDSTTIGIKGKYKVELNSYNNMDSTYVEIKFLEKKKDHWFQKQKLELPKDGVVSCDPKIIDFNNDKLNDLTFKSSVAARGANEIRTLLIFEKSTGRLKLITNSGNYPNLQYNEILNCVDSWMVSGGTSTIFLKIDQDSLREFAGVELYDDNREIYLVNKKGEYKILKKEKIKDLDIYTRFKNFSPLIENKNTL